ncbi:Uncharacterized protein QTN25_003953 [Entamoeba marina]
MQQNNPIISIGIIGQDFVGKSTFFRREIINSCNWDDLNRYVGTDFLIKDYLIDRKLMKARIWDLSVDYHYIKWKTYIRFCKYFIALYDVNRKASFDIIVKTIREIKEYNNGITIILVGNKIDLNTKEVTSIDGMNAAKELGCLHFYEISLFERAYSEIVNELLVYSCEIPIPITNTEIKQEKDIVWKCLIQ